MSRRSETLAGLLFLSSAASAQSPPAAPPPAATPKAEAREATDLAILYAGASGGEREQRFVEFLETWFPEVQTISLEKLDSKAAEAFDVVVADWMPRYKDGRYQPNTDPKVALDAKYAKPTICVGSVGSTICGGKLDWL